MTAAATLRALRDAIAAERRAAADSEYVVGALACVCIPWTTMARAHIALDKAQAATDAILAAAMDAPPLTPELREALDALVEADLASGRAIAAFDEAVADTDGDREELGALADAAVRAYDVACVRVIAAYKAGAR